VVGADRPIAAGKEVFFGFKILKRIAFPTFKERVTV